LDHEPLGWQVDPRACKRGGAFSDGRGDLALLALADLAKSSMAAMRIVPTEEASAERLSVFGTGLQFEV
jgi:hypothetical protein